MSTAAGTLPSVKKSALKKPSQHKRLAEDYKNAGGSVTCPHVYHKCRCYGHEVGLPNYKLLTIPRTNNYYAATGGCPCIPRVAAHPGSWRLKEGQLRSTTYRCGSGCVKKSAAVNSRCCNHSGDQYGWRRGPHTVLGKNTAATGKCDTFGNLAFKSTSTAYGAVDGDDVSDVSSASPQKLEDLEALILEEHRQRMRVEEDVNELTAIKLEGTADFYKKKYNDAARRRLLSQLSDVELEELLRDVKYIVKRPLNQTNMGLLRRILDRQKNLQGLREYYAAHNEE